MAAKKHYKEYVKEEHFDLIPKWKRQGQKDDWVAKKIGIGKDLLIRWKKEHVEFRELFKKGTAELLLDLEETLYTRAKGYIKNTKEYMLDKDGKPVKSTIKVKETFIWSDSNLQFALKKLDPEKWGDKKVEEEKINIHISDLRDKHGL